MIENLMLEHLKNIQTEQASQRKLMVEMLHRFAGMETGIARLGRDLAAQNEDMIHDRHRMDLLATRIERIETRLSLAD